MLSEADGFSTSPTNIDFTDYFKKCENFEGMRMHYSSTRMPAIDKGEWVYFNRNWDILQQGSGAHIALGDHDDQEEEAHLRCARHRHRLTGSSH